MLKKLGKYELYRKLGAGATSTVYLGFDPFAQREVAIKVATPDILSDPEKRTLYSRFFLNEASLVGKLNHPHIAQIYDAVVAEDLCYVVMEYVPGGTLEQFIKPGKLLPVDKVVEIIFKCTRALNFAHRLGITHRDIKPANILLTDDGGIKISDFGAALTSEHNDITQVSGVGSPCYMSPEQVQEVALDQRTDIYSLGIVMFQLLTGKLPFDGDTQYKIIYQIIHNLAPAPSSLRPGLPKVLDDIVERALTKDRDARYLSWEAFAHDLAQAVRHRKLAAPKVDFADTEKFATLRALPFFNDFSDVEIWEVLRFSEWRHVPPGARIMRDGENGEFFCFLTQGELEVSKAGQPLGRLKKGDCFGEMAVIRKHRPPRNADISALSAANIVTIRGEALEQASEVCRMHFFQGFVEVLANRLASANQRIASR